MLKRAVTIPKIDVDLCPGCGVGRGAIDHEIHLAVVVEVPALHDQRIGETAQTGRSAEAAVSIAWIEGNRVRADVGADEYGVGTRWRAKICSRKDWVQRTPC